MLQNTHWKSFSGLLAIFLTTILSSELTYCARRLSYPNSIGFSVFRYLKCCSDQSHPCGIKKSLFFAITSTMNNPMNNQDPKFSAPPKDYTNIETILDLRLWTQDRKQAQTPVDTSTGMWHNPRYWTVIIPNCIIPK